MKKIISILLGLCIFLGSIHIVMADKIDYSCYAGNWTSTSSLPNASSELYITYADDNYMNFYFRWGQFAVTVNNAQISNNIVYGEYYEVWDDSIDWDNYVINGNITLTLEKDSIRLKWIGYENGNAPSIKNLVFKNDNFSYKTKNTKVMLNNETLTFDQMPVMLNDRVMVPIRAIFEAMGYSVDWNQNTQTATAVLAGNKITVQLNNKTIYYTVNGVSSTYICDVEPQIVSDRILVPVRAIAESAGCDVSWDGDSRTVYINMDIIYETKTVSVKASTLDEWNEKIESIERGLIGVSNLTKLDANGNEIFNGKIIIDREIISYNKIGVKVPNVMGPYTGKEKEYKTVYFNIPSEIKYVLHKHETQNKATVSSIGKLMAGLVEQKWVLTQTCNCGYENVVEWSIPDFTPLSTDKLKNEYTVETTTSLYID